MEFKMHDVLENSILL